MDDDDGPPAKKVRVPKVAKVKNKMPAEVQITAEQLLHEASHQKIEKVAPPPRQKISDPAELAAFKMKKRKEFEDNIRKNRAVMSNWLKYARWEDSQQELQRARSVYERAIDVDHRNVPLWLKYAEMEMRNKQINHARNVWDRAVTILPRANQFWYKYTYMEEMLGNVPSARQIFERWMQWEPEEQAWLSYIKMELRYKELDRARAIYERFVQVHPDVKNWVRYARFEEQNGYLGNARNVFERATEFYGVDLIDEKLYVEFARFEERCREYERARTIYKYAMEHIPKSQAQELFKSYTQFEKKYGDRAGIEDVIINKRKFQYEEEVKANPTNYDAWFDYVRLIESDGNQEVIREVYERAISNIPPSQEKRFWRRYIYLWVYYALYEELVAKDMERTGQVYRACLEVIPHKKFTFAKVWMMYAKFEVRQKDMAAARKALGTAIGKCPKSKIFKGYIELELQLREFDRCRKLYEKFLEYSPSDCHVWVKYAELESILGDGERARAIFELAIKQPIMDMPEVLWKAYIDFEVEQEEYENTRQLYERLLERTQHVKVWLSFARFEASVKAEDSVARARGTYSRGNQALKTTTAPSEERVMLLEAWRDFEKEQGDGTSLEQVRSKLPRRIKKRRKVYREDGSDGGWEEYWDYIFPDDEAAAPNLKLLQMARLWKQKQHQGNQDADDDSEDSEEDEGDEKEGESKKGAEDDSDKDNGGSKDDDADDGKGGDVRRDGDDSRESD